MSKTGVIPAPGGIPPQSVIPTKAGTQGTTVIPAQAGTQGIEGKGAEALIPACAGMTILPACAGMTEARAGMTIAPSSG